MIGAILAGGVDPTKVGGVVGFIILVVGAIIGTGYKSVNGVNRAKAAALSELVAVRDQEVTDLQRQVDVLKAGRKDADRIISELKETLADSDRACEEKMRVMDDRIRRLEAALADREIGG